MSICSFDSLVFFIFIILNTKVPLMFQQVYNQLLFNGSREKVHFDVFAIFSNGSHLGFLS